MATDPIVTLPRSPEILAPDASQRAARESASEAHSQSDAPGTRAPSGAHWQLITGEYPPQPGGVSDYTRLMARALVRRGHAVHIWAPTCRGTDPVDPGVTVHRLPGHFGLRGILELSRRLPRCGTQTPHRLWVQYVPHMYGWKGMNLLFCCWLSFWLRGRYRIMFHEVSFPSGRNQPWKHRLLGAVTEWMAGRLARNAECIYVSTALWEPLVRRISPRCAPIVCLPIPSNISPDSSDTAIAERRRRIAPAADACVLGHFGTYGSLIAPLLQSVLPPLLQIDRRRVALLLGKGGEDFAQRLIAAHPTLAGQLVAPGMLSEAEIAWHLGACDLLLQPYPDGATTRRTTLMAGLALGKPTVTTSGELTEPLWHDSGAVALAAVDDPAEFIRIAEGLLASEPARRQLGERGRALYSERFDVDRAVSVLNRSDDENGSRD